MSTTSSTKSTPSSHDAPSARVNERVVAKEVRAHEHARHRTKERREHALAKERKEKAAAVRVLGLKVTTHGHGAKLVRRLSMESWDGEEPEEQRSGRSALPGTPVQESAPAPKNDAAPPRHSTSSFAELTLGDFISRPRRPKAKRECSSGICRCVLASLMVGFPDVAELDFELISPIHAVIALDDAEADEPWEYITRASLNDGSVWKGKSYAQAVASAM